MLHFSYDARVHALRETAWKALVERAQNPPPFIPDVVESKIVQQYDDGFMREVTTKEFPVKERVRFNEADGVVRYQLLDHPFLTGEVTTRIAPTSVQSPVAPVMLTVSIIWERKVDKSYRKGENLPEQIKEEVTALKRRAEEMERAS